MSCCCWGFRSCAIRCRAWRRAPLGPHARRGFVRVGRILAALYAAVAAAMAAGWTAPLLYWVAPLLLGQPLLRLVLLAEHAGCPLRADMHVNTRTTFTNPFVRFVTWNMPYHIEHHLHPGVPFFALPRLRRATSEARGTTSRGYARFHLDYVRALAAGRGPAFVRGGESGSA
ncbi:MAG: fatty acid desaturase [Alphaproteobacteria bacterium]|nr:fatty acid desaturase [Alphaproteobacteria bacterium]